MHLQDLFDKINDQRLMRWSLETTGVYCLLRPASCEAEMISVYPKQFLKAQMNFKIILGLILHPCDEDLKKASI